MTSRSHIVRVVASAALLLPVSLAAAQPATPTAAAPASPSVVATTPSAAAADDARAAAIVIEEARRARTQRFISGAGWFAIGAGGVTYGLLSRPDDHVVESPGSGALRIIGIGFYGIVAIGSVVSAMLPEPIERLADQARNGRLDREELRRVAEASRRGRHANGFIALTAGLGLSIITGVILGSDVLTRRDRVSLALPAAVGAGVLLVDGLSRLTWERTVEEQAWARVDDRAAVTSLRVWGGPIAQGGMIGVMSTW